LTVASESALEALRKRLVLAKLTHTSVVECDAPYDGQLMAIGLEPVRKEVARRVLSSLPKRANGERDSNKLF
jgi:hypothetical protein